MDYAKNPLPDFDPSSVDEYSLIKTNDKGGKRIFLFLDKKAQGAMDLLHAERNLVAHPENPYFFASAAKG